MNYMLQIKSEKTQLENNKREQFKLLLKHVV